MKTNGSPIVGCVVLLVVAPVLYAVVFAMGAYVTGSINGGGAVALFVAFVMFFTLVIMLLKGRNNGRTR